MHSFANRKDYSAFIIKGFHGGQASKGQYQCPNPDCRCDVFYRHGTYERHFLHFEAETIPDDTVVFKLPDGSACVDTVMEILRVKCAGCGMTHGIGIMDMVPFQVFSLPAFLMVLLWLFPDDVPVTAKTPVTKTPDGISWHVLRRILLIYVNHRARMMAALRQQSLHEAAADLSDVVLVRVYLGVSPPGGAREAYLLCHKHPVMLGRRSTVSYPLRFIFNINI